MYRLYCGGFNIFGITVSETVYNYIYYFYQYCGSGIRCLFDPWTRIRDPR
jgi:hypothetical protein